MIELSDLQPKHVAFVEKHDMILVELDELKSCNVLLGACKFCPLMQNQPDELKSKNAFIDGIFG